MSGESAHVVVAGHHDESGADDGASRVARRCFQVWRGAISPSGIVPKAPRMWPMRASLNRFNAEDADETELAGRRRRAALSLHLRDQCVGNLEVGGDVLDVVVVLELAEQSKQPLARLVVDRNSVLRPPDEGRLARFAEPSLE